MMHSKLGISFGLRFIGPHAKIDHMVLKQIERMEFLLRRKLKNYNMDSITSPDLMERIAKEKSVMQTQIASFIRLAWKAKSST